MTVSAPRSKNVNINVYLWPRCRKSNNIVIEFVEIEVVNIQFTEIGQVIIELYYNIELIERKTCI